MRRATSIERPTESSKMVSLVRAGLMAMFTVLCTTVMAQEICDNAIDDDNDGLIDLNDPDCECHGFNNSNNIPSLIPNPSFELMNCCPTSFSQLNCAQDWVQATSATSDYQNTQCYTMPAAPMPVPHGTGFVGAIFSPGWQEYVGSCLLQPLNAGEQYELNFDLGATSITGQGGLCGPVNFPPIDITIFGNPSCNQLPYSTYGCPGGNWQVIGTGTYDPVNYWAPFTITFTPTIDIAAIMIGSPCTLPGGYGGSCYPYFVFDNLILNETSFFAAIDINSTGRWCDDDIQLSASSDSSGGTWQWYKAGIAIVGQTASTLNVSTNHLGAGNYTAVYTIGNDCDWIDLIVEEPDFPSTSAAISNVCFPDAMTFDNQTTVATGNIISWQWDFGDNSTSDQQSPTHTYANDGTYNVQLIAISDINCPDTLQAMVTAYPKPDATFSVADGCLATSTAFTDETAINAPGNIATWQWDLGDGSTSASQNPSHLYGAAGSYNIQLITVSSDNCSDTVAGSVDVFPPPVVDVSAPEECSLDDVQFVNNSSIPSGTIDQVLWEFGDGLTSALPAPVHSYAAPGTYSVVLTITSDQNCPADTTFDLVSYPNPVIGLTATDVCADVAVPLVNTSSVVAPGTITAYVLDMGDNSALLDSVPNFYQYASPGTYNIELIATTQQGCDDTLQVQVNVNDLPVADFNFVDICEDDSLQFTDLSVIASGAISNWQWDFGNSSTANVSAPGFQTYPSDSFYPVQLIVASGFGCSDTANDIIEIFPVPIADFAFDSVCYPLQIQFTDLSDPNGAYSITDWQWEFSDGQTSALPSPSIDFGAPGTYSADLLITNAPGCKSTFSDGDAVVHPVPSADFPAGLATCFEDTIFFLDQSSIIPITDDVIDTWNWTFDDGTVSDQPSPFHVYGTANLYDVYFNVMSNHGCSDTVNRIVEVYPLPLVDLDAQPMQGCAPLHVQFLDHSSIPNPYSIAAWNWYLGTDSTGATIPDPFLIYDPEIAPLDIAQYDIGLKLTSANGCISEILIPDYITVYPKPDALFSVNEDVMPILKPTFEFTDLSTENVNLWDWNFGDGLFSIEQNPVHDYLDTGVYHIVLMVETEYGCRDTIDYHVKVEPVFTFYIPNSFTPNADGINETFYGQGMGYTFYSMFIYDRWGELIFTSDDDKLPWNGTYKGQQVQQGTYIYRFYLLDWEGHDHKYSGKVVLHR